jgi:archaellum component FlaC
MFIAIGLFFLGLCLGWAITNGANITLKGEIEKHVIRSEIADRSIERKDNEIVKLKKEVKRLTEEFLPTKNKMEDTIENLTKERDEAREYAERCRERYKQLKTEQEAKSVLHNFVGRTV